MKAAGNLFLTSVFAQVAPAFAKTPEFAGIFGDKTDRSALFIPTAAKPERLKFYVKDDREALKNLGFAVEDLDISEQSPDKIREKIMGVDAVCICGGNSFYLLQEIRRAQLEQTLREFLSDQRKLLIGSSAGAVVCAPGIEYAKPMDDSRKGPELRGDFTGMNLTDFAVLPHFGEVPFVLRTKKILAEYGRENDFYTLSNSEGLFISDKKPKLIKEEK